MRKTVYISILCLTILLLPFASFCQSIQDVRIDIQLIDVSLGAALKQIENITTFKFLANAEDVENKLHININVTGEALNKVLDKLLSGLNLVYKQVDDNIYIKRSNGTPFISSTTKNDVWKKKYTVHGSISSVTTGEVIIGATITIAGGSITAVSNEYGFYSLSLPEGNYTMHITSIGLAAKKIDLLLARDLQLHITMEEEAKALETVVITSNTPGRNLRTPQMSVERINVEEIRNVPVLFGERDILKTIQLLPGVKSAGEGNSGFYVRGGGADQNLILLDEAPVYNASHLLGFFSTFNSDAIKNVTLYKGAMPPQYGGRLSSVVDIKMNDGNNQDFGLSGGIGLIASRLNIEGPLQKDKSSFLISARRTYADVFLKLLGDSSMKKTQLYFYDLNAKTNFILGKKDRLYFSAYFGRDVLSQEDLAGINWGNATATLRCNHIFSSKLFSNTSFIFSNYDYKINVNSEANNYGIFSRIRDWNVKEDLQWYVNSRNTLSFGLNAIFHSITPGEISIRGNNGTVAHNLPDRYSLENALYANNTWKTGEKLAVTYGLRLSAFSILGKGDYYALDNEGNVIDTMHYKRGEIVKTYVNPEPRIAASYQLNNRSALKLSYTRNTQNLHLISNSTSSSPTDKLIASTNIIKPEIADQFAIGFYKNWKNILYELTIEAYHKTMQHQIDYRNGAQVFTNEAIESQLLFGSGRAYGIEWQLKKTSGKLNGWISYTLSKTERRIEGINANNWYNARQDRTHDIAIVGMYQLSKKWSLSANWIFYTGDAVTYPSGKYRIDDEIYFYYSERNGYRMPSYHRLDIGATKQLKKGKRFSSELNFSIYNAYGRANAYQINFRESKDDPTKTEAVKTSLFTFVPSLSYNFKI